MQCAACSDDRNSNNVPGTSTKRHRIRTGASAPDSSNVTPWKACDATVWQTKNARASCRCANIGVPGRRPCFPGSWPDAGALSELKPFSRSSRHRLDLQAHAFLLHTIAPLAWLSCAYARLSTRSSKLERRANFRRSYRDQYPETEGSEWDPEG